MCIIIATREVLWHEKPEMWQQQMLRMQTAHLCYMLSDFCHEVHICTRKAAQLLLQL